MFTALTSLEVNCGCVIFISEIILIHLSTYCYMYVPTFKNTQTKEERLSFHYKSIISEKLRYKRFLKYNPYTRLYKSKCNERMSCFYNLIYFLRFRVGLSKDSYREGSFLRIQACSVSRVLNRAFILSLLFATICFVLE